MFNMVYQLLFLSFDIAITNLHNVTAHLIQQARTTALNQSSQIGHELP